MTQLTGQPPRVALEDWRLKSVLVLQLESGFSILRLLCNTNKLLSETIKMNGARSERKTIGDYKLLSLTFAVRLFRFQHHLRNL